MRTLNYVFAITSLILGILWTLFLLTQTLDWNIGYAIGIVLVINGIVRLWFADDDT